MAGTLEKPQIIVHLHKDVNYTLYDAKWVPSSAKFVNIGSHPRGTGALQIYEVSAGGLELKKEVEKKTSFKCGTFGASSLQQRHLATGDFNGKLMMWDLDYLDLPTYSTKAHDGIVNAIDGCGGLGVGGGAPELVTGGRDGAVKVWDTRQKEEPVACMEPREGQDRRDCWSVCFGDSHSDTERSVCAAYDNGDVKLFDLRTMSLRWETNLKNGICGVEFDRKDIQMNKLVATTLESCFTVFDMRTRHPTKAYASLNEKVKQGTVWCSRHLPQNRDVFMTCGGNGSLNLWKYSYPAKRQEVDDDGVAEGVMGTLDLLQNVTVSTQPISTFDWSRDKEGLAVCTSFDQSVRVVIVTKLNRV